MDRFSLGPPSLPTTKKPKRSVSMISTQFNSLQRSLRKPRMGFSSFLQIDSLKATNASKTGTMATAPELPPRSGTPSGPLSEVPAFQEDLYRTVPCSNQPATSEVHRTAASFVNPLYYGHQSENRIRERRRSESLSTCSSDSSEVSDLMTQRRTPTQSHQLRDNDTDSICFLEKTSPSLIKSERYVDTPGSFVFKTQNKTSATDHVYESCDASYPRNYDKPVLNNKKHFVDIFQTMSFKSPLYGTTIPPCHSVTSSEESFDEPFPNDTYDVPGSLPPSYPPPPLPPSESPPSIPPRFLPPAIPVRTAPPLPVGILESPPDVPARMIPPPVPQRSNCSTPTASLPDGSDCSDSSDVHLYDETPRDEGYIVELRAKFQNARLVEDNVSERSRSNTPTNVLAKDNFDIASKSFKNDRGNPFINSSNLFSNNNVAGNAFLPTSNLNVNAPTTSNVSGNAFLSTSNLIGNAPTTSNVSSSTSNASGNAVCSTSNVLVDNASKANNVALSTSNIVRKASLLFSDSVACNATSEDANATSTSTESSHESTAWSSSYRFVGNKIEQKSTSSSVKTIPKTMCSGFLFQIGTNKDLSKKWVTLSNGYLNFYRDNMTNSPDSVYLTRNIMGATIVNPNNSNLDCPVSELWHFKIYFDDGKPLLLGTKIPSERSDWMQNLATQMIPFTEGMDTAVFTNVQVATHMHVKIGVAGNWQRCYTIIHQRLVSLWVLEEKTYRCLNLQHVSVNPEESFRLRCERAKEMGPSFHLELPQQVLYFQSDFRALTNNVLVSLKMGWTVPINARLQDQYLTQENVPVAIDKCLKFVSTHGTMLEGIYRLSGSSTKVKQLLERFSENVWSVHLSPDEYSAHDVASALKRYLRTLPECLLTEKLYKLWVETSLLEDKNDRLAHLQYLLSHLLDINYQTLRKIIGHLCIIAENSNTNLMPVINLAPVFGPTLLYKSGIGETHNYDESTWASDTVSDLISHYVHLFQVDEKEMERERKIQQAVQKMKEARLTSKPAGDLLVGVYIYSKDWGVCINVKLSPSTTARDICEYAISVANVREPLTKIVLMEVVCDGELERLLHYTESVLEVTLSWSTWGIEESKGNYLCIKHNSVFDAIAPLITNSQPLSAFGEILYADSSTKSFKKFSFEFTSAKLKCFKNSKNAQKLNEWNIEDITWYIGSEKKRSTPTKWAITFIPRLDKSSQQAPVKRSRNSPYFGSTMCFQSEDELHKWIASFLIGKHPKGLLPVVIMPDLLS